MHLIERVYAEAMAKEARRRKDAEHDGGNAMASRQCPAAARQPTRRLPEGVDPGLDYASRVGVRIFLSNTVGKLEMDLICLVWSSQESCPLGPARSVQYAKQRLRTHGLFIKAESLAALSSDTQCVVMTACIRALLGL